MLSLDRKAEILKNKAFPTVSEYEEIQYEKPEVIKQKILEPESKITITLSKLET